MNTLTAEKLRVGAWHIDSNLGQMTRGTECVRLEPRMLRLLLCLADRAGQVVSAEELLEQVWPGVVVSADSVYQAIASLRRLLGDDPKQASYIVTVPRQGYRMVAEIGTWIAPDAVAPVLNSPKVNRRRLALLIGSSAAILVGAGLWWQNAPASHSSNGSTHAGRYQKSIAVLPFLDLTEYMKQEYFADGMTEELIGRLSKIPGVRVPAPTSSFYFKGKQLPVADIARQLDVNYILDGSVRTSGRTMRISARLVKADNAFVIWTETYDRPVDDLLKVQDDISENVTKALKAAIVH
ncbi:transcriptional regulator [Duganella sp. FT92W]|uniref:Transcriptional regulator n=1 Tax=Pseudoduganella rivuli TaxID=2666085 RepID=A0A7X2LY14_9BURK|nr:winged helix-turn-helix domain-containing protein [Pseudoduganella rivuli]MRV76757.1 transcriptional regulator [Pseudoduganella rivuli]